MTRMCVAIVGGGFSGVALAALLARRGRASPQIVLIEKGARVGRGLAYGTNDPAHLLNVRAANMSALPDEPDHFARWLARRRQGGAATFAPRRLYGVYIEETLRRAPRWMGPPIQRRRAAVVRCTKHEGRWLLEQSDGRTLAADAVVLALGNAAPSAPGFWRDANIPLLDPWDANALRRIPGGDVLILGTGLTAVDVALTLSRRRKRGVIYALSRRGQLPKAHVDQAPLSPRELDLPVELSDALFALRKEVEAMAQRGEPWQHAIDRLRSRTPELWRRLPIESQYRFLRHLRPWWDAHRHRMAPEVAAQVSALQTAGRLSILAGEVVNVEPAGAAIDVHHRQRGSYARHRLQVAGVVNCTGAAMDMTKSEDPFVRQLIEDGLVRPHENGLGVDVDADGRVIDAQGNAHDSLYALGPITQGAFWEATAVPDIRVRAAALASALAG